MNNRPNINIDPEWLRRKAEAEKDMSVEAGIYHPESPVMTDNQTPEAAALAGKILDHLNNEADLEETDPDEVWEFIEVLIQQCFDQIIYEERARIWQQGKPYFQKIVPGDSIFITSAYKFLRLLNPSPEQSNDR